jgi:hypothetical protein
MDWNFAFKTTLIMHDSVSLLKRQRFDQPFQDGRLLVNRRAALW